MIDWENKLNKIVYALRDMRSMWCAVVVLRDLFLASVELYLKAVGIGRSGKAAREMPQSRSSSCPKSRRKVKQRQPESNSVRLAKYRAAVLFERRVVIIATFFTCVASLVKQWTIIIKIKYWLKLIADWFFFAFLVLYWWSVSTHVKYFEVLCSISISKPNSVSNLRIRF